MSQNGRLESLLELLKSDGNDLFLNYALGIEYTSIGNYMEAETQFKKVLALDENYIAGYYQMGKLLEVLDKNEAALGYFQIGLEKAKLKKDNKAVNEFGEAIFMLE